MKHILIINGSGGVGKDTFVDCLRRYTTVKHTSIINIAKKLANLVGWDGSKNEKDRKFLSDLKVLIDVYNDSNYLTIASTMQDFLNGEYSEELLCVDMREKEQIQRAKREFGAKTILIVRNDVEQIKSNLADAGVYEIKYDYIIPNNGSIEDLSNEAKKFIDKINNNTKN